MQEYIQELEEKTNGFKETKKFIARNTDEKFQERFREIFGECTLEELKFKLDVAIGKCIDGFEKAENRNQLKLHEQKKMYDKQNEKMQKRIQKLQKN